MSKIRAAITGVQGWVPEYVLTNQELENLVDTTSEWITSRTGIHERRILKGEGQGTSIIGINAVKGLLAKTNTLPEEIDLLICATVTSDMPFPDTANIIADAVGIKNAFCYDINAACSGFLYALTTASKFVESGSHKKVIVVGADKMSSIIDYTDRTTCIIFGDGGGAVLLEPTEEEVGVMDSLHHSDGIGQHYLFQKAGGSRYPPTIDTVINREHFVYQNGKPVFKAAVSGMSDVVLRIMERNSLVADDIAWLVPHQANRRIIDATADKLGIGHDRVVVTVDRHGNTSAASIPLALAEAHRDGRIRPGQLVLIEAMGGGFTWGSALIRW